MFIYKYEKTVDACCIEKYGTTTLSAFENGWHKSRQEKDGVKSR